MLRQAILALTLFIPFALGAAEPPPAAESENPLLSGFPNIPADARRVAERLASCNHFAGEFNGDGGERDKEVNAALKELSCDTIERDVAAIRRKYAADPTVEEALRKAEAL
jgi:hypothetical protein